MAHKIDAVLRENMVDGPPQARQICRADHGADVRDVFAGEDGGDTRERGSSSEVDALNVGRAMGAAHDNSMQHPRQLNVFHIGGGACDKARVFLTADALADEFFGFDECGGHELDACFCGGADRVDNVLVAGAAAKIAVQTFANFVVCGVRVTFQNLPGNHDHARRAEAALQGVFVPESFLHGVQDLLAIRAVSGGGQAFNGQDGRAVGLNGEHAAALDGFAVYFHGAGSAERGFAARVGTGEPHYFTEIVDKQQAGLHFMGVPDAVNGDGDGLRHSIFARVVCS